MIWVGKISILGDKMTVSVTEEGGNTHSIVVNKRTPMIDVKKALREAIVIERERKEKEAKKLAEADFENFEDFIKELQGGNSGSKAKEVQPRSKKGKEGKRTR